MSEPTLTCEEVLKHLVAYLDRETDGHTAAEIEHHLEKCRGCFSRAEFEKQLLPILDQVARAKQLHMVFDISGSGLVWADRGMNLTAEVIAALNAGSSGASAAPSSAAPSQP